MGIGIEDNKATGWGSVGNTGTGRYSSEVRLVPVLHPPGTAAPPLLLTLPAGQACLKKCMVSLFLSAHKTINRKGGVGTDGGGVLCNMNREWGQA